MAKFYKWKKVADETVTAGSNKEYTWKSDGNYTLKRIFIIDKSGGTLWKTPVTISVEDWTLTDDKVPAEFFNKPLNQAYEFDISITLNKEIKFALKNEEGSDISIMIILELWK